MRLTDPRKNGNGPILSIKNLPYLFKSGQEISGEKNDGKKFKRILYDITYYVLPSQDTLRICITALQVNRIQIRIETVKKILNLFILIILLLANKY